MSKAINTKLVSELEQLGFNIQFKPSKYSNTRVCYSGTLASALRFMQKHKSLSYSQPGNKTHILSNYVNESDCGDSWRGGSQDQLEKDLAGDLDLSGFLKAREELAKLPVFKRLKTNLEVAKPKRKRKYSDQDGELEYDRLWEVTPYHATQRLPSSVRCVTFKINFSFSAGENRESINRYGQIVWALADLIEKAGIQTRIILGNYGSNTGYKTDASIEFELKKPGQYISPSLLAASFTCRFFRRLIFGFLPMSADLNLDQASSSYGQPERWNKRIEFTQGELRISSGIKNGITSAETGELESEILKAVGLSKAELPISV